MSNHIFIYQEPFITESGKTLPVLHLTYTASGQPNKHKSNVVWVFHALTANGQPLEWWPGLIGDGKLFNEHEYYIISVNMPGSCYGSIGPLDKDPSTDKPYYHNFPLFTTRDMIRAYQLLRKELGIEKIHIGIGGSMGGQQLLEWAIDEPELFEYIIPIATNAKHSPWGIAFNATQRWSIENDPTWSQSNDDAGLKGMEVARGIALLSYRTYETYHVSQQDVVHDDTPIDEKIFNAESYQHYQGLKLAKRFNAFSYYFLSRSMDAHDVGRNRGGVVPALRRIRSKALIVGIRTDILFPFKEQEFLAQHILGAELAIIHSQFGHDGFLLESEKLAQIISKFLKRQNNINQIQEVIVN